MWLLVCCCRHSWCCCRWCCRFRCGCWYAAVVSDIGIVVVGAVVAYEDAIVVVVAVALAVVIVDVITAVVGIAFLLL